MLIVAALFCVKQQQFVTMLTHGSLPCCPTFLQDEVDRMVNEAERFATEDKGKREAVETKNNAESLVYQTEKQIKELGDKVPADVKTKLEDKIKAVR